jgi:hypothetical protein
MGPSIMGFEDEVEQSLGRPCRQTDSIQSSKMVHAALLLLMLGARTTVTPFHHQPEAQHPKIFQLFTSRRPITPSFGTMRTLPPC